MRWSAPNWFPFTGASFVLSIALPFSMNTCSRTVSYTQFVVPLVAHQHRHTVQERNSHQRGQECARPRPPVVSFDGASFVPNIAFPLFVMGMPSNDGASSQRNKFRHPKVFLTYYDFHQTTVLALYTILIAPQMLRCLHHRCLRVPEPHSGVHCTLRRARMSSHTYPFLVAIAPYPWAVLLVSSWSPSLSSLSLSRQIRGGGEEGGRRRVAEPPSSEAKC